MLTEEESDTTADSLEKRERREANVPKPIQNSHHVSQEVKAEDGVYHRDGKHI